MPASKASKGELAVPGRRINRRNADSVRQKIQVTQLVKVLQDHAFGKIRIDDSRRDSAKFLINKSMPNPPEDQNLNVSGGVKVIIEGV